MTEGNLKAALMVAIREQLPNYTAFRIEDQTTSGIPDIAVTGFKRTSWIEAKYANPRIHSLGRQDLTMVRLAQTGHAFHVVYLQESNGSQRTLIVEPRYVIHWRGDPNDEWRFSRVWAVGFDHNFVVDAIRRVHELNEHPSWRAIAVR